VAEELKRLGSDAWWALSLMRQLGADGSELARASEVLFAGMPPGDIDTARLGEMTGGWAFTWRDGMEPPPLEALLGDLRKSRLVHRGVMDRLIRSSHASVLETLAGMAGRLGTHPAVKHLFLQRLRLWTESDAARVAPWRFALAFLAMERHGAEAEDRAGALRLLLPLAEDPVAWQAFLEAMHPQRESHERVRLAALKGLSRLKVPEQLEWLQWSARNDPHPEVRDSARRIIARQWGPDYWPYEEE
jgi:hypothetical protein